MTLEKEAVHKETARIRQKPEYNGIFNEGKYVDNYNYS